MDHHSTRRSLAGLIVVAALTVMAVAQMVRPSDAEARHAIPEQELRWLAAGDSYAAGFGLPGVRLVGEAARQRWGSDCGQAPEAWPALAADRALGQGYRLQEVVHRACSGAVIDDLLLKQIPTDDTWDLVTLSIGGNDAGFLGGLLACIGGSLAYGRHFSWFDTPVSGCPADDAVRSAIEAVDFDAALAAVGESVTFGGHVVVVGYPALFETYRLWNLTAKAWGLCHGVDRAGAERVRGWAGLLNARIGAAVERANARHRPEVGFSFVNINDGVGNNPGHGTPEYALRNTNLYEAQGSASRHNLCGSDSWLFGSAFHPYSELGFFHPKRTGHVATAQLVSSTLANLDWSRLGKQGPTLASGGVESLFNASVPSLCGHPAGSLVNGELRGLDPRYGFVEAKHAVVGDLSGDGSPEGVLLLRCSFGGNAAYPVVYVYDTQLTLLGRLPVEKHVESVGPRLGPGVEIRSIRVEGRVIVIEAVGWKADEPNCCPSNEATVRLMLADIEPL